MRGLCWDDLAARRVMLYGFSGFVGELEVVPGWEEEWGWKQTIQTPPGTDHCSTSQKNCQTDTWNKRADEYWPRLSHLFISSTPVCDEKIYFKQQMKCAGMWKHLTVSYRSFTLMVHNILLRKSTVYRGAWVGLIFMPIPLLDVHKLHDDRLCLCLYLLDRRFT